MARFHSTDRAQGLRRASSAVDPATFEALWRATLKRMRARYDAKRNGVNVPERPVERRKKGKDE
jgi:hypothetical protein